MDTTLHVPEASAQDDALQVWKANFFKALAHPTRIRVLETLRDGEKSAGEIMQALGLEQSNVSQHLAVLRSRGILVTRREGTNILYSARDLMLYQVLDLLRRYFFDHLTELQGMLLAMGPAPVGEDRNQLPVE